MKNNRLNISKKINDLDFDRNFNKTIMSFAKQLEKDCRDNMLPQDFVKAYQNSLNICRDRIAENDRFRLAEESISIAHILFPRSFADEVTKLILDKTNKNPDPFGIIKK